jgi:DNA-binding NarL/FixJ family response regulator
MSPKRSEIEARLAGVRRILEDLLSQSQAYVNILQADGRSQTAILALQDFAQAARNEIEDLEATLQDSDRLPDCLTTRERQVIESVARGLANKQIAYELGISERTVEFHLNSVFRKTETHSRTEAVMAALRLDWIDPP